MQKQFPVRFDNSDLKPCYSNAVEVTVAREEVLLTFLGIFPPAGSLISRIVMSPAHAKRLLNVLGINLANYEKQFGKVEPAEEKKIGFQPGTANNP